nr:MAG TPA: hypothetical protein [Caudoviricetes sp.]
MNFPAIRGNSPYKKVDPLIFFYLIKGRHYV